MIFWASGEPMSIRVRDLATGAERTLDTHPKGDSAWGARGTPGESYAAPAWLPDGRLVTDGAAGLVVWDLATGTSRLLRPAGKAPPNPASALSLLASPDAQHVVRLVLAVQTGDTSSLSVFDLASGGTRGDHVPRQPDYRVHSRPFRHGPCDRR